MAIIMPNTTAINEQIAHSNPFCHPRIKASMASNKSMLSNIICILRAK